MSNWTYFNGIIAINSDVNLSQILQHAPVGSEGGLLLYNINISNIYVNKYMIDHGLRDVTYDENLKYKINFWLQRIKRFITDLSLRITFTEKNITIFYFKDKKDNIISHTFGKLK